MKGMIFMTNFTSNSNHFKIKDPGSAITHFIGMLMAVFAATPLIIRALSAPDTVHVISLTIFIVSMILLYAASTTYHTFDLSPKVNMILKKLDHCMIFVLIAGSYTPVCLLALDRKQGIPLLVLVWATAIIGIIIKIFFINCPHWVSSIIYIGMGWTCVLVFKPLLANLPASAFAWLLAGGIIYTVGGIIYGLKLPIFDKLPKDFGSHEIFNLFVMGGSICHFIFMYAYLM